MSTAENIKRIRIEKGFTQKQLGKLCGMADSAIRRYESGRAKPKIETAQRIANALGVPLSDVFVYEQYENAPEDFTKLLSEFAQLQSYKSTQETICRLGVELLRLSGIIIEFEGCEEILSGYVYDEKDGGIFLNGILITECSDEKEPCKTCKKRENTCAIITYNNNSIKLEYSMFCAIILSGMNEIPKRIINITEKMYNKTSKDKVITERDFETIIKIKKSEKK